MSETMYFEEEGKPNTDATLQAARDFAHSEGIENIVVASTTGFTAARAAEVFGDRNLVVVTHVTGRKGANLQEFPAELREELEGKGVEVLTTSHAFDGVNQLADQGSIGMVIRETLRMFCEGVKVCVEIAAMASDAGLIPTDGDVVSIAGTGKGADTAMVLRPAISRKLFEARIKRIIAKPL